VGTARWICIWPARGGGAGVRARRRLEDLVAGGHLVTEVGEQQAREIVLARGTTEGRERAADRGREGLRRLEPAVRIARHRLDQRGAHAGRKIGAALADVGDRFLRDRP